jgi:hypothetical protein
MDNVSAHKQYSFPWVSEFVDEDSDGWYTGLNSTNCEDSLDCTKKISFVDESTGTSSIDNMKVTQPILHHHQVLDTMSSICGVEWYLSIELNGSNRRIPVNVNIPNHGIIGK